MPQDPQKKSAVVLLSGGLEGRTPLHALTFNYGQRHAKELACAAAQASAVGAVKHAVIDISFLGDLLKEGSALLAGGAPVPDLKDLSEDELTQPPTYVPNRNMMLLSMTAAYAEAHGVQDIFYGAQAQDEYGYSDCTHDFIQRLNETLALNRKRPITVHAPFADHPKAETVRRGLELNVNLAQTWSCYRGDEQPCQTCPTCVERRNAFDANGVADPLLEA
jgi:7-cyano-7-deazaguanine synthase